MNKRLAVASFVVASVVAPLAFAADATMEKAKEFVDDSAITTKIKAEFTKDKVNPLTVKVDTDHGVVKLSGTAKTKADADKAVQVAKATKGVVSVTDEIKVDPSGRM